MDAARKAGIASTLDCTGPSRLLVAKSDIQLLCEAGDSDWQLWLVKGSARAAVLHGQWPGSSSEDKLLHLGQVAASQPTMEWSPTSIKVWLHELRLLVHEDAFAVGRQPV